jgi:hypothetical protein
MNSGQLIVIGWGLASFLLGYGFGVAYAAFSSMVKGVTSNLFD